MMIIINVFFFFAINMNFSLSLSVFHQVKQLNQSGSLHFYSTLHYKEKANNLNIKNGINNVIISWELYQ